VLDLKIVKWEQARPVPPEDHGPGQPRAAETVSCLSD